MFLHNDLKKIKSIKRNGELTTVNLPAKTHSSYDILINVKNKELTFIDGESIFIIDEQIGISEESEFTLFFVDKYIVAELQWGRLYLKDNKGKIYYVTETGSVVKRKVNEEKIKWVSKDDLLSYLERLVSIKFNIPDGNKMLVEKYIDNLSITVVTANEKMTNTANAENLEIDNYMYRIKVKDYYFDLGLDLFDYRIFEKCETGNPNCNESSNDVFKSWEEEKRKEKAEKLREQKAEMEYKRLKDGEDIVDTEIDSFEDFDGLDDDELDIEEDIYGSKGFTITDAEME